MSRQPPASLVELRRELGRDWQTPVPDNPTPRDEADCWAQDAETVYRAACRVWERRRAQLVAWHRERLVELGEVA